MAYKKGQCGIAASYVRGTIDQQMLSSLGLNPLNITTDKLAAIEMTNDEAKLICGVLEHVTLSVPVGSIKKTILYIQDMFILNCTTRGTNRNRGHDDILEIP